MIAVFDHSREEAPGIVTFYFKSQKTLQYTAGQFIELAIAHDNPDERGTKRWFTLSSSPREDFISITTRILPDSSSFKHALKDLKKGNEVHISEPMGDFVLPKDTSIPLVFIAAGMGVTPFRSIFQWMHDSKDTERSISFLYAVQTEDDIIFQDTFDSVNIHATIVVHSPSEAWGGERGRLDGNHILKLAQPQQGSLYYLAGPEGFVETLTTQLIDSGIKKSQLVTDLFSGYSAL